MQAKATDGFILIDVLVAFLIASLTLGVLFQAASQRSRAVLSLGDQGQAELLASSKLTEIGVVEPLRQGKTSGAFDERFRWLVEVTNVDQELASTNSSNLNAFKVEITIDWTRGSRSHSLSLATLRIAPKT